MELSSAAMTQNCIVITGKNSRHEPPTLGQVRPANRIHTAMNRMKKPALDPMEDRALGVARGDQLPMRDGPVLSRYERPKRRLLS